MKGRIAEVFDSIQGEGLYLGHKQIFTRFFGCNLLCKFCDTRLNNFREVEPAELVEEIKSYSGDFHSVSFTGGEPLLQKDFLKEALKLTKAAGFKNYLETNGTLFFELRDVIDNVDIVSMDLKFPSSSGMGRLWWMHNKFLKIAGSKEVFIKAVICQETVEGDLIEAINLIKEVNKSVVLVLQPNSLEHNEALTKKIEDFREICRRHAVTVRVIPQTHKMMGIR